MDKKAKSPTTKSKPKKKFNPDVIPVQAKTYAPLHRTLRGTRKF